MLFAGKAVLWAVLSVVAFGSFGGDEIESDKCIAACQKDGGTWSACWDACYGQSE